MSMFRKNQTPTGLVLRVVSRCDLPGSVTALCPVEKEGVLAGLGPARQSSALLCAGHTRRQMC